MELEWDEAKRDDNLVKHGLDLVVSSEIFADYFMERLDTRHDYGEHRWVALGMIRGVVVVLVYTERGDTLRPISLRKATAPQTLNIRQLLTDLIYTPCNLYQYLQGDVSCQKNILSN